MPGYAPSTTETRTLLDANHLSVAGGQSVSERVAQFPPEVADRVPLTINHAGAPPVSAGGNSSGGGYSSGGSSSGGYHVPGQGGTCDNL